MQFFCFSGFDAFIALPLCAASLSLSSRFRRRFFVFAASVSCCRFLRAVIAFIDFFTHYEPAFEADYQSLSMSQAFN